MAWLFADSFDFYSTFTDAGNNFWDLTGAFGNLGSTTTRFSAGQYYQGGGSSPTTQLLAKSVSSNDTTHHICVAFRQTSSLGAATNGGWFTLYDGTSAQCSVVFRGDGSIILTSGASSGATLGTVYSGAFTSNAWTQFEFEITINNTTGAWHVRKEGASSDNRVDTGLNTRAGSANNYANKIAFGHSNSGVVHHFDDFLWFSTAGAAPNTWVGDVRSIQDMPISNNSPVQFTPGPIASVTVGGITGTVSKGANSVRYFWFRPDYDCLFTGGTIQVNANATANVKIGVNVDNGGGAPGAVVGSSNAIVNPVAGSNVYTFASPLALTAGVTYWVGVNQDATVVYKIGGSNFTPADGTVTYASFPTANPSVSGLAQPAAHTMNFTGSNNYQMVKELIYDGTTSYVADSTVGHVDSYNLGPLAVTPPSIIGVQTRAFLQKTDAGARTGSIFLKSGAVTNTTNQVLSTSPLGVSRVDTTDPNTGVAWTAAGIAAAVVGGTVVA